MRSEKKARRRRKLKFNALTVWIVIEVIALLAVIGTALFVNYYLGRVYTPKPYTLPTHSTSNVRESEIELPTDLLKGDQ